MVILLTLLFKHFFLGMREMKETRLVMILKRLISDQNGRERKVFLENYIILQYIFEHLQLGVLRLELLQVGVFLLIIRQGRIAGI